MEHFHPPDPNSIFFQSAYARNQFPPGFVPPPLPPPVQQNFVNPYSQPAPVIPAGRILDPTPNATSSLIAGIIAILLSLAWCKWYGTFGGIVSGLLALHLSGSGLEMVRTSPDVFSTKGVGSLRAAKVLGIVSLCISGLWFLGLLVVYFAY